MSARAGVRFEETLSGPIAFGETDPIVGARSIRRTQMKLSVEVTASDVERFATDPNHEGRIVAKIHCSAIGPEISVAEGSFRVEAFGRPQSKRMVYDVRFTHGKVPYSLEGVKEIRSGSHYDLWTDTTTLYTRLRRGVTGSEEVIAAGMLTLSAAEFTRVMGSVRPISVESATERERLIRIFGELYAGDLWTRYVTPTV